MGKFIDILGQKFGRLTAVKRLQNNKKKNAVWLCACECGGNAEATGYSLRNGHTKSCGCLRTEMIVAEAKKNSTHGLSGHPAYHIWGEMMRRCIDEDHPRYDSYGGRGIGVCDRWKILQNYIDDMWPRPGPGYSVDRIDNDGDYSPENCRWATNTDQQRNKRSTVLIRHNGEMKTATEWSEIYGINAATILHRHHEGWPSDEVMHGRSSCKVFVMYKGEMSPLADVARSEGVNYQTMIRRKHAGWSDDEVVYGRGSQRHVVMYKGEMSPLKVVAALEGASYTTMVNRKNRGWSDEEVIYGRRPTTQEHPSPSQQEGP